jgi:polyhydroxyalkanoate synthase subunit PhaC
MNESTLRPDQLWQEFSDYGRRLGQGVENLLKAGPISTGVTPRSEIYREDKLRLYRYQAPASVVQNRVPLLIIYALVNRPYMADLQEDRSLIRGLLEAGQDVYLIDWGYPDAADSALNLDDYLNGYIDNCVNEICRRHQLPAINLLGICQGGTFSLCYSALHPQKVKNLIAMVTPVDFKTPDNLLSHWVQQIDVDLMVDTLGNVSGDLLNMLFLSLKPFALTGQKYINMVDLLEDEEKLKNFLRMEKWIFDSPDQAGEAFREFIKEFYQKNALMKRNLTIGGRAVDLEQLTMPIMNVYAIHDHLVPPDASRALRGLVKSRDYSELNFKGGHIGIYVSGKAQQQIPPAIGKWLNERS